MATQLPGVLLNHPWKGRGIKKDVQTCIQICIYIKNDVPCVKVL